MITLTVSAGKDLQHDLSLSQASKGGVKRKQKASDKKTEAQDQAIVRISKIASLSATPLSLQPESVITESEA